MSYELSVITHPSSDIAKPSLIIEDRATGDRTLIGKVPGGLQRKCNEMHLKTSRLTNIFFSGILNWESISGLPGLILTISDQGVKKLGIYHSGNNVIQYMISCWRYFIFRFGLDLNANDTNDSVEVSNIKYTPINIKPLIDYGNNENKKADHDKLQYMMSNIFPMQKDASKPVYNSKKIANVSLPNSIVNPKIATNWIITPNSVRGKFLVGNAKKLGCQIPHYKDLCNFKSVTLDDGTIITPEQVLEPTRYFNPVLVLDIPSEDYLSGIFAQNWTLNCPNNLPYASVFHFIDDSIADPLSNKDYIEFIKSFGPETTHFISHPAYSPNCLNFLKTFRVSLKWKSLLSTFFPLPKWSNSSLMPIPELPVNVLPLVSGQKLILKSTAAPSIENANGSETSQFTIEEAKAIYDTEITTADMLNVISKEEHDHSLDNNNTITSLRKTIDPTKSLKAQTETLILGTGSALPSNIRNVLCNIVRVPFKLKDGSTGFRSVVLDAGENSFGSLKRLYQEKEVDMILDELSLVYLSHLHADHHLGIIDFIREWNQRQVSQFGENRSKKLFVITPWQYEKFLNELNQIDPFIDTNYLSYVSCDEFMLGYVSPSIEQVNIDTVNLEEISSLETTELEYMKNEQVSNYVYESLGMSKIVTCSAFHCDFSYSCRLSFKLDFTKEDQDDESNIFTVSYSGDTRPKPAFSFIGENSDLLIHESTLEDEKYKDAVDKRHSTTSEAVQVGILMKAKKIILTHFSQRYKSFTCSELVYKRLEDPICKEDLINRGLYIPSPPSSPSSSPRSDKSNKSIEESPEVPLEAKSLIFSKFLSEDVKQKAKDIKILFAFDNMKVQFDEFHLQRDVFERQGHKLETLFSNDQEETEGQEEDAIDDTIQTKKSKKQRSENGNKKRKVNA